MLRAALLAGAIWFAVALVLGVVIGRWLRQRPASDAARRRPEQFRNSA